MEALIVRGLQLQGIEDISHPDSAGGGGCGGGGGDRGGGGGGRGGEQQQAKQEKEQCYLQAETRQAGEGFKQAADTAVTTVAAAFVFP